MLTLRTALLVLPIGISSTIYSKMAKAEGPSFSIAIQNVAGSKSHHFEELRVQDTT